jgi:hypothetical protein
MINSSRECRTKEGKVESPYLMNKTDTKGLNKYHSSLSKLIYGQKQILRQMNTNINHIFHWYMHLYVWNHKIKGQGCIICQYSKYFKELNLENLEYGNIFFRLRQFLQAIIKPLFLFFFNLNNGVESIR